MRLCLIVFLNIVNWISLSYAETHGMKDEPLSAVEQVSNKKFLKVNKQYLDQCADERKVSIVPADPKTTDGAKLYAEAKRILSASNHRCVKCHSPGRNDGSKSFTNILDRDELINKGMIDVDKPENSRLFHQVKDDSMPLDGEPLNETEKASLLAWLKAGAPDEKGVAANELPFGYVSEHDKYLCMVKDLRRIPKEDRTNVRYFSLTHFYNSGRNVEEVKVAIDRLINSFSEKPHLKLSTRVDAAGTLLRINLKDYGWTPEIWKLISDVNPYQTRFATNVAKEVYKQTADFSSPEVRGDWFVFKTSQPPLYNKLAKLPETESEFLKYFLADQNSENHPEKRFSVGNRRSGVSNHNRVFKRLPTVNTAIKDPTDPERLEGYVYISDDFASSDGEKNIFAHPSDYKRDGGEYIVGKRMWDENGNPLYAQVYGLFDREGKPIESVDPNLGIVSHPQRPRHAFRVANGVSCWDCHERVAPGIINPGRNEMASHIRNNSRLFNGRNVPLSLLSDYRQHEDLLPIYEEDQKGYQRFMDATGGRPGAVFNVATAFEDEMSERQIAAELGIPLETFRVELKKNPDLIKRLALDSTGSLSRASFLNEFKSIISGLNEQGKILEMQEESKHYKPEDTEKSAQRKTEHGPVIEQTQKEFKAAPREVKEEKPYTQSVLDKTIEDAFTFNKSFEDALKNIGKLNGVEFNRFDAIDATYYSSNLATPEGQTYMMISSQRMKFPHASISFDSHGGSKGPATMPYGITPSSDCAEDRKRLREAGWKVVYEQPMDSVRRQGYYKKEDETSKLHIALLYSCNKETQRDKFQSDRYLPGERLKNFVFAPTFGNFYEAMLINALKKAEDSYLADFMVRDGFKPFEPYKSSSTSGEKESNVELDRIAADIGKIQQEKTAAIQRETAEILKNLRGIARGAE